MPFSSDELHVDEPSGRLHVRRGSARIALCDHWDSPRPERSVRLCGQWESPRAPAASGKARAPGGQWESPRAIEQEVASGKARARIAHRAASGKARALRVCRKLHTLWGKAPVVEDR